MTAALARNAVLGALIVSTLSACGIPQRFGFGGAEPETPLPFRTDLDRNRDEPRLFTVSVEAQGAGIDAVRESVRHPATGYCLITFGGSDIDWDMDGAGEWRAARTEDGDLVFSGTCTAR